MLSIRNLEQFLVSNDKHLSKHVYSLIINDFDPVGHFQ